MVISSIIAVYFWFSIAITTEIKINTTQSTLIVQVTFLSDASLLIAPLYKSTAITLAPDKDTLDNVDILADKISTEKIPISQAGTTIFTI